MQIKSILAGAAIAMAATVSVASAEDQSTTPKPAQFTTTANLPAEAIKDIDAARIRGEFTVSAGPTNAHGLNHPNDAIGTAMSPQSIIGLGCFSGRDCRQD